jgi:glucose-6-phosphate isomerase
LAKRGRANMTIHIDRVDAWHVGGLMMLLEIATAYAGQLYGVDAFNQPGVELGKQFAYALLGRPGADAAKAEWDTLPRPDARWHVDG